MAQVDPPEVAVAVLERFVAALVRKRHLPELVQAVRLAEGVEGGDVRIGTHVPVAVREAGRGVGVLAEGDDVGAGDGEEVAGLVALPQRVGFGAGSRRLQDGLEGGKSVPLNWTSWSCKLMP